MSLMQASIAVSVLLVLLRIQRSTAYSDPWKFLIVSDARAGSISYMPVSPYGKGKAVVRTLVPKSSHLIHPQGLAVDQATKRLLVADPDLKQIISYTLHAYGSKLFATHETTIVNQTEARWVTVDSIGNIYFSDEANNKILKVDAFPGNRVVNKAPQVVYDSAGSISAPGGVATDNFNLYWTNKVNGDQAGVLVTAPVEKDARNTQVGGDDARQAAVAMSKNIAKAYGVCLANHDIYYTAEESSLYGMPRTGGDVVEITNALGSPRGCAWDGEGTMYIADRGQNGIYSFNAPQELIQEVQLQKVVDFADAFGLAVFSLAARTQAVCILAQSLLGLAVVVAVYDFSG